MSSIERGIGVKRSMGYVRSGDLAIKSDPPRVCYEHALCWSDLYQPEQFPEPVLVIVYLDKTQGRFAEPDIINPDNEDSIRSQCHHLEFSNLTNSRRGGQWWRIVRPNRELRRFLSSKAGHTYSVELAWDFLYRTWGEAEEAAAWQEMHQARAYHDKSHGIINHTDNGTSYDGRKHAPRNFVRYLDYKHEGFRWEPKRNWRLPTLHHEWRVFGKRVCMREGLGLPMLASFDVPNLIAKVMEPFGMYELDTLDLARRMRNRANRTRRQEPDQGDVELAELIDKVPSMREKVDRLSGFALARKSRSRIEEFDRLWMRARAPEDYQNCRGKLVLSGEFALLHNALGDNREKTHQN
jgi:hypothetical protein